MKNLIALLLTIFSLLLVSSVSADPGFQPIINTTFPLGDAFQALCGPNDEAHVLLVRSTNGLSVYSKKVGDPTWLTTKALSAAYDSPSRKLPLIKISSGGYGCVIGQSSNQTFISYKVPGAGWTTAVKLGDLPSPFNSTNFESFDCATNNKGEVLAVWRDDDNLKESFKGSGATTFTTTSIKTGLKTAADKIYAFQLALTEESTAKLLYLSQNTSGDAGFSMSRTNAGIWSEDGEFAPRRADLYFMGDMEYDSATKKAILGFYFDKFTGNVSGAGYYFSIFDLSAKPQFSLIGATDNTTTTSGSAVSGRTLGGQFQTTFAFITASEAAATAQVKVNNVNFPLNSITKDPDPKVQWYLSDAEAAYTGANSVIALSSRAMTKQDPNNSQGLSAFFYELKGSVIKNGQQTDRVLLTGDQTGGNDVVTGFTPSVAGCASGNAFAAFSNSQYEFASVDFLNDSATDLIPTPVPTGVPTTPGTSGTDGCPGDINKLEAGVCGCGVPDTDSNLDTLVDCGSPRVFVKNIIPQIISATPNGKGNLNVQLEGLAGTKLKYVISVKGKGFKKDYTAKKFLTGLKKLPSGTVTLKLKVFQKQGKKTIKSKFSPALQANVS